MNITRETTIDDLIKLGVIKAAKILLWNIKAKQIAKDKEMLDQAMLVVKLFKEDNAHHAEQYPTEDDESESDDDWCYDSGRPAHMRDENWD